MEVIKANTSVAWDVCINENKGFIHKLASKLTTIQLATYLLCNIIWLLSYSYFITIASHVPILNSDYEQ